MSRKRRLAASASATSKYSTVDLETAKSALLIRGANASSTCMDALREINLLKKPLCKLMTRKNPVRPFDDEKSIEFMCQKNHAALFACGTHNKKRPHSLTLGRLFDGEVLDMMEFGIKSLRKVSEFSGPSFSMGTKPLFIFQGTTFESDADAIKAKSLILDFFRGHQVDKIALAGLERVCVCTFSPGKKLYMRHYVTIFEKAGAEKAPAVKLLEVGPSFDLALRRTSYAPEAMMKQAMRRPKTGLKPKRVKNVARSSMSERVGRLHMEKQDFTQLHLHKGKALKGQKQTGTTTQSAEQE